MDVLMPQACNSTSTDFEYHPVTSETVDLSLSVLRALCSYRDLALRRGHAADASWAMETIEGARAEHARLDAKLRDWHERLGWRPTQRS
jgi:hypothetical protein